MSLFGWVIVGLGVAVAAWLVIRMNKTNDSSAAARHSGVGYDGLELTPNAADKAIEAHSGVGFTGLPASTEAAPVSVVHYIDAGDLPPTDAIELVEKAQKKAAKKAPAKKAAAKTPKKTSK